jgi:phage tail tube protein FII
LIIASFGMVKLDGVGLFGEAEAEIEVSSFARESIERSTAGLDGMVSIDLGGRGRKIRQKGKIRARSKTELNSKIEAISAFIDGDAHTLVGSRGETFENLRVDSVSVKNEQASGSGIEAEYEIIYLQLVV